MPLMREIVAIRHRWDQEFVTDTTSTTDLFGHVPTPWEEALRATVDGVPVTA
jgi:hypothetical protein